MNQTVLTYLPRYFTSKAIAAYFIALAICLAVFPNKLPVLWIGFGLAEVLTFFYFTNRLSIRWANMPSQVFVSRVFRTALVIRIIYVVGIYLFYLAMTGIPFEFSASDSFNYNENGLFILKLLENGHISQYFTKFYPGVSDSGYPLFLSIIYLISFKSIMIARLVNALLGAWMVILIYRIAQRNFGEPAARISAIMAMLLPTLIYHTGLHLKETTMIFLLLFFVERAEFMIRSRILRPGIMLQVAFLGLSLFFFRTVLAAAAWFAIFSAVLFSSNRLLGSRRKLAFTLWFVMAALFVFSGSILTEVSKYIEDRSTNQQLSMDNFATRKEGNKLAKYGSTAIFVPLLLFAPFPTLVDIPDQKNAMMINGAIFDHNVYAFFVIIALVVLYKRRLIKSSILILAMTGSYMAILAMSGFALSERFHVPLVPFYLILAGYGISVMEKRYAKFYVPFIVIIGLIIIGWNWFKLAGRGFV